MADRNDIIITKAAKGGAVVFIDVEDYVKEANINSAIKTVTNSFNMTQHNRTKDWSMTQ